MSENVTTKKTFREKLSELKTKAMKMYEEKIKPTVLKFKPTVVEGIKEISKILKERADDLLKYLMKIGKEFISYASFLIEKKALEIMEKYKDDQ